MLSLILKCLACIFAFFAAFSWPPIPRIHLGWLAIGLWILAELLAGATLFR